MTILTADEIAHISKVLEKNIPKGYHQLVTEYVRQSVVSAVGNLLLMFFLLGIVISFITIVLKSYYEHHKNMIFEDYGDLTDAGAMIVGIGGFLSMILFIVVIFAFTSMFTEIEHAVAPNYYLIKSFL